MDGILIIDKPSAWTSHDVVAKVRRLTRLKRIGHTGTLDPMATGVLVVCLGQATRIVEYLVGHDKRYRATIRLGIETNTYDADGRITLQHSVAVSEATLREALSKFVGEIAQVPPMYSALKRGGQKLVDLARQGVEVEREPRKVTIYSIDVLAFDPPDLAIDVHCSTGTYIRSLAHDVGRALGCGAHLAALTRTAAGRFTLDQAISLEQLQAAVADGSWTALLRPLDAALTEFPAVTLSETDVEHMRHGLAVPHPLSNSVEAQLVRVYDPASRLVGLVRVHRAARELRPEKIFAGPETNGTRTNTDEH
ncbi:MAG TPA: tRNA pseudouridine(55) synthase TruB [Anaerolineae bacterium]